MTTTASDLTDEHYDIPLVRNTILRFCQDGGSWRALNGDQGWYISNGDGQIRLRTPDDYDNTAGKYRTLYATLDLLDPSVKSITRIWDNEKSAPEEPIGTFEDCLGFTLGSDTDGIGDIRHDPSVKKAVEAAAQFQVDKLRAAGITESVHCLFSGGGIYVLIHHGLSQANPEWSRQERDQAFRSLTGAYNLWLTDVEKEFFEAHPEYKGKVKIDKLNHQKRKFKVIFSLHKKHPFAVIPLDPSDVCVDFERARLPLKPEVLAEGEHWYTSYDPSEKQALKAILGAYTERVVAELEARKNRSGTYEIERRSEPLASENFPPCIKNIIIKAAPGQGPHRALAVLASYLYQVGWTDAEAFTLWDSVAEGAGVESRIFDCWYGAMSCPSCKTIQQDSTGYPKVGLGGLGYCEPDENCDSCMWPGGYGIMAALEKGDSAKLEPSKQTTAKELWEATPEEVEALTNTVLEDRGHLISEEELEAYSLPEGPKFECKLPMEHFIQRFIAYGSEVSDAYPDYWLGGALYALAVVADKKIKVILRQGTYYPNIYISINGKSSLSRKSTAVDKTEILLCQALPQIIPAFVPTEFSAEAFIEHLSENNHAPWIRDEAAGVLSLMKKEYMRGFKDSLMQLYDCKPFYRKLRTSQRKGAKSEFRVDDPYLNLLWATTDASLGANTDQNDTLSGFLARFMFFFPQGKKPKWMPLEEGTARNSIFEGVVRDQLSAIAKKVGDIRECTALHFSLEAAEYYTEWQRIREDEWTATNDGSCMQIYSRLAPSVVKLVMLFELGSTDFDPAKPIRLEFMQEACRLVDEYLMPTARAVYDLVGSNAEKNVIDRITAYLKTHGGKATRKEILRDVKVKSADFDEYLFTMIESGVVETKNVKRNGKGRDSLYVFLLSQPKIGNVANVANVAIVANVEKIPSKDSEISESTLATLATKATQPTVDTIEAELQQAAERAAQKEAHDKTPTKQCARCGGSLDRGSLQVNEQSICLQCFNLEEDL